MRRILLKSPQVFCNVVQAEDYPAGALCGPPSDPAPPHTQQQPQAVQELGNHITSHAAAAGLLHKATGPLAVALDPVSGEPGLTDMHCSLSTSSLHPRLISSTICTWGEGQFGSAWMTSAPAG
jgi:hypothetical protein